MKNHVCFPHYQFSLYKDMIWEYQLIIKSIASVPHFGLIQFEINQKVSFTRKL